MPPKPSSAKDVAKTTGANNNDAPLATRPKLPTGKDIEDVVGTRRLLLQRWKENQDRLHAGVVRFHGRMLQVAPQQERLEGPDKGLCAFDFARQLFRFDRASPHLQWKPGGKNGADWNAGKWVQGVFDAKWIKTPDRSIQWIEGHNIVEIVKKDKGPLSGLDWFDVRSLGLVARRSLTRGTSPDELFEMYSSRETPTLISEADGVYRIAWVLNAGQDRQMLWLDANKGCTPTRMEQGKRSKDGNTWLPPFFETTASWQKVSGVWVVKTLSARGDFLGRTFELELSFDWESVNAAVPPSYFAVESIELKPGDAIIDSRSDKPLVPVDTRPQPHISAVPSSKPIKTTLTAEMAQLVESMAASSARTDTDQLRVAVFSTKNGDPTGTLVKLLESKLRCKSGIITAEEIRAGALKKFDVVLFPGGSGSRQADELHNEGRQAVRQFVEEGGGYVGICAGAFLASCRDQSSLNLINVIPLAGRREVSGPHGMTSIEMGYRGGGILKIELTAAGSKILGERSGLLDTDFSGGPVFIPAGRNDLPACVSLAFYRTEVWLHKVQRGTMVDTPAILAAPFGKGRVIVFGPHPEFSDPKLTPGLDSFVTRAVLATARKSK